MTQSLFKRCESYGTHVLPSCTAGIITFYGTLATSTWVQWKMLGISTGTLRPIPSLVGMTSVALASLASHVATVQVFAATHGDDRLYYKNNNRKEYKSLTDWRRDTNNKGHFQHTLRVCTAGLVIFKLLGGRFWSISPSSLTQLGSFARPIFSIPASNAYANPIQRQRIEQLGRRYGCHTCGSKMLMKRGTRFHADHMPPQSVVEYMNQAFFRRMLNLSVRQRFYPQCISCSNKQGGILSRATKTIMNSGKKGDIFRWTRPAKTLAEAGGGQEAHFHGLRPRLSHCTGFLLGAITVMDADPKDVLGNGGGNPNRFIQMQRKLEHWFKAYSFL